MEYIIRYGGEGMKVVLVSGFLNEHLLPICSELSKRSDFYFIATQDFSEDVDQYKQVLNAEYVLHYYNDEERNRVVSLVLESDVVIFGGSSLELLELRKMQNKLSFVYTERLFKRGTWRRFIPSTARILERKFMTYNQNLYVLCAGSYVKNDLKLIGFDTQKCFKFGYFPVTDKVSMDELLKKKNHDIPRLLYAGRLIRLKRVGDILKCCKELQKNGQQFECTIIGDGPERRKLEKISNKYNFQGVKFIGGKEHKDFLEAMAQSNLSFISSNYYEGWGAVVNESLSRACPVIASSSCGSTSYLIKDGYNGYTYKVANIRELYNKALAFLQSQNKEVIYKNAYDTITKEWNASVAAERFIKISLTLIDRGEVKKYESGPLSKC